jgi:hypothetical protein
VSADERGGEKGWEMSKMNINTRTTPHPPEKESIRSYVERRKGERLGETVAHAVRLDLNVTDHVLVPIVWQGTRGWRKGERRKK